MTQLIGKNVLVTGGMGFIGRNLVARLLEEGAVVTIADRDHVDARRLGEIAGGALAYVPIDVCDAEAVMRCVAGQEIVFHLAGHSGPVGSLETPFTNLEVNCLGMLNLLNAVKELCPQSRIVFPSSRLVYGRPERLPVTEEHSTRPITLYGIHKLAAEGYLRVYGEQFGLASVILRISNPFGPHIPAPHHKYNILNWFIDRAQRGEELTVFGEGGQLRDYLYVADLVEAFLLAATREEAVGGTFNIGGEPVRFVEVAETVVQIAGRGVVNHIPWPAEYKAVETGDWDFDETKAKEVLGWEPQISLEEGIRRTIEALNGDGSILSQLLRL